VLGYLLGITLVLTALSPLIHTEVFADSVVVDFDKQQYNIGDSLTISGEIDKFLLIVFIICYSSNYLHLVI